MSELRTGTGIPKAVVSHKAIDRSVPSLAHLNSAGCAHYSILEASDWTRVALMLTPHGRGNLREQFEEVVKDLRSVLSRQKRAIRITAQTVFLRNEAELAECRQLVAAQYGSEPPVTTFVIQPPCCGAALAVEAWGIGGHGVVIRNFGEHVLAIEYDGVRRVYCSGIVPSGRHLGVYHQTMNGLDRMAEALAAAGSDLKNVVRTWLYLGSITGLEGKPQRYQEMNRARADYYRNVRFCGSLLKSCVPRGVYPASTGIGTAGDNLVLSCLALETSRPDVFLLPLENPQQTPAYAYHPKYSAQSPKFSRAICLAGGDYLTTWVSGTASIVNSESQHPGDITAQTERTIENIEHLISPENFVQHQLPGGGAQLSNMAKIRVYVKRASDLDKCRAVCERRFGRVPAIYAVADICRPELLVEIEGVAFSGFSGVQRRP